MCSERLSLTRRGCGLKSKLTGLSRLRKRKRVNMINMGKALSIRPEDISTLEQQIQ